MKKNVRNVLVKISPWADQVDSGKSLALIQMSAHQNADLAANNLICQGGVWIIR